MRFLSQIITDQDLSQLRPGEFNVLKAPPGSGKTTFMFDDRILSFAGAKKKVLYLIHNKMTRDFIAERHSDKAVIFNDCNMNGWFEHRKNKTGWIADNDEDKVHVMCYQTFAALLRNEGHGWLDDIDLIVWDEFDDIRSFYNSEIKRLQKALPGLSKEQSAALLNEYNNKSIAHFVQEIKDAVLAPAKILLLAISATPEIAALLFQETLNNLTFGTVELLQDALQTIYIHDVQGALLDGTLRPQEGRIYWCFTRYIHQELTLKTAAERAGFKVFVGWNPENKEYKHLWTPEQSAGMEMIKEYHMAPEGYDFIIVNGIIGRGVDIFDERIQDWIYDGDNYEDALQFIRARFAPHYKYLPETMRGLVDFVQNGIPAVYYEWHSVEEMRQLIKDFPLFKDPAIEEKKGTNWEQTAFSTWNAAKKYYEEFGRVEMRKYGRARAQQYRIKPA